MTEAVVLVGPVTVGGPGAVAAETVAVALGCLDDGLALLDDEVIAVDELWCNVIRTAAGSECDGVTLVCPSWWSTSRRELIAAAARGTFEDVSVLSRVEVLADAASAVVEVAPDLVVVHEGGQRMAVPRVPATGEVVDLVADRLVGAIAVVVDVPTGTGPFGDELRRGLRRRGIEVTLVGDEALRARLDIDASSTPRRGFTSTARVAVVAAAMLSVTGLVAAGVEDHPSPPREDVTWLVEGRVAVEVPADWLVERVMSGPGSARMQVLSPSDRESVLHVTQSRVPEQQTLDVAADGLRTALAEQPSGVFVDFVASDRKADRPVVSYREVRADRNVWWTVLLDRGIRIAIGCQGAPDDRGPSEVCDRAIRSAHSVTPK